MCTIRIHDLDVFLFIFLFIFIFLFLSIIKVNLMIPPDAKTLNYQSTRFHPSHQP